MTSRRPPPCLTVRIPGKPVQHSRNASLPAFGISSFSHRIPRSHSSQDSLEQARRDAAESGDDSEMDEAAVAMAQVGSRAPSRLLVHPGGGQGQTKKTSTSHSTIPISVDVHPPTPNASSLPVTAAPSHSTRRRSRSAEADLRALKQSRRVASIYSVSSSTGGSGDERNSWYLRPDLSGASSLSLDQLPRTVSLEDLTIRSVAPSGVSTTGAVETLDSAVRPSHCRNSSSTSSLYSTASPSSPAGTAAPSIADSHLALASHAAPPAAQHQPSSSISLSTRQPNRLSHHARPPSSSSRFREVLGTGPNDPRETEADRLKRLYLCPWEGTSPKPAEKAVSRSRSGRSRVVGVGSSLSSTTTRDPEKGGVWEEKEIEAAVVWEEAEEAPTRAEQQRKRLLINLLLVFLGALVFADLLVLNVRVFGGRDAYLSE